jgi:hypothetical protein
MTTPLAAPTAVASSLTGTTVTVTWQDPNATSIVSNFTVTFVGKNGQGTYTPPNSTTTGHVLTLAVAAPATGTPTLSELASGYAANVVANPANPANYSASPPGLQIYWTAALSLTLTVGSQSFTLSTNSVNNGIYRLPVSTAAPLTVTYQDVVTFAGRIGVSDVPTAWPNGTPINQNDSLSISKLVVDTKHGLFALDIAFTMNYSPFTGLTFNSVGLSVQRTDGVTVL